MKRTKNFLALILALMMAFSCMVMPAMAAADVTNDEVMPLGLKGYCTGCGRIVDYTHKDGVYYWNCPNCGPMSSPA